SSSLSSAGSASPAGPRSGWMARALVRGLSILVQNVDDRPSALELGQMEVIDEGFGHHLHAGDVVGDIEHRDLACACELWARPFRGTPPHVVGSQVMHSGRPSVSVVQPAFGEIRVE